MKKVWRHSLYLQDVWASFEHPNPHFGCRMSITYSIDTITIIIIYVRICDTISISIVDVIRDFYMLEYYYWTRFVLLSADF